VRTCQSYPKTTQAETIFFFFPSCRQSEKVYTSRYRFAFFSTEQFFFLTHSNCDSSFPSLIDVSCIIHDYQNLPYSLQKTPRKTKTNLDRIHAAMTKTCGPVAILACQSNTFKQTKKQITLPSLCLSCTNATTSTLLFIALPIAHTRTSCRQRSTLSDCMHASHSQQSSLYMYMYIDRLLYFSFSSSQRVFDQISIFIIFFRSTEYVYLLVGNSLEYIDKEGKDSRTTKRISTESGLE
jgi:hypothetical protein